MGLVLAVSQKKWSYIVMMDFVKSKYLYFTGNSQIQLCIDRYILEDLFNKWIEGHIEILLTLFDGGSWRLMQHYQDELANVREYENTDFSSHND
jgi:hypothetical protein